MNTKIPGLPVYRITLIFFGGILCLTQAILAQKDSYPSSIELDNWLETNVKDMGGRVILQIWKGGKPVYSKSLNEMSGRQKRVDKFIAKRMGREENAEDYSLSTRQPVASCSKWFSAALVMTLVDEGKLTLSDTVGKYLPVLSAHGKGNITISQCLSHLTGIQSPPLKESLKEMKNIGSMDEAVEKIAEMPMEGAPGKVFHYSNAGLQIAGAVIEKISGKSFESLFAERIAGPLGMTNTDFGKGRVALPAGGAGSTTEDYMHFLVMILQKGVWKGHRILSERSIEEMQVNRISPAVKITWSPVPMDKIGYGFGEWILPGAGSFSSPGLFGSIPLVDYNRGYCAFLMTFYLKNQGREERLLRLKQQIDTYIDGLSGASATNR